MLPETEEQVRKWSEKPPAPKEEMFPSYLLECNKICCRKERARIGIERREENE